MAPPTVPKELSAYLASSSTTPAFACDALEEWILSRRSRGDTLFDVSVGLIELEEKTPPHLTSAFDHARYLTNIPDISNLTPPTGVFPLHRSQSPATILAHLLSQPAPSIEHSREVILEYVLARETKARDKRPGKGGKGTLSRDALEEISDRLTEVESGLMTDGGRRLNREELDESRMLGMTLILSLRMSLSYFTLQELSKQLVEVPLGTGERILVQHIRRRLPGEGRWAVGKELEFLETLTLPQRPSLRPAYRSAKARTQLSDRPLHPVSLPAPGKSSCIKLIQSYAADTGVSPTSYFSRRGFAGSSDSGSPKSPTTPLPLSPTTPPSDPSRLAAFAQEVLTEYVTREKREYMLKTKWARTGRDQLGRDLGEIEQSLCLASKQQPTSLAPTLVPVFLVLRRSFLLPDSPLPAKLIDAFIDLLPPPPDPDDTPFREPSVQTATSSLYVNPRLGDAAAFEVLQELIVYEKEILEERGMGNDVPAALVQIIDHVEKRFPDGSYQTVFAKAKELAANNGKPPAPIAKQSSMHRRAKSHLEPTPAQNDASKDGGPQMPRLRQHSRSTSLPHRRNTVDSLSDSDESIGIELTATHQTVDRAAPVLPSLTTDQPPMLPPLSFASPIEAQPVTESGSTSAGGWWDVVSAVQTQPPSAPWHDNVRSTTRKRTTSGGFSSLPVPPGAEPASIQQAEPLMAQLQTLEKVAPTGTVSRPISTHGTPNQPKPLRLPSDFPSPQAPAVGLGSPTIDFSKRPGDATLNEELGNLMISPERSFVPTSQSASPIISDSPAQVSLTPVASGIHRSESSTPMTGSPMRPTPPQQPSHRAQTDTPVRPPPVVSDSDSDDDHAILLPSPSQLYVSPQQYRPMLQPSPRPAANAGTPMSGRPSPAMTPSRGTKPKPRGWKSVSAAMGISKDKEKVRDKERENSEKVVRTGNRAWPENDPGRWNKNMVANIMGPPAERR